MGGGLMQLVAYGAQDVYLTGNAQITLFKVVYRRHTNFSMECIELPMDNAKTNGRSSLQMLRNGDLAAKSYLRLTVPDLTPTGSWAGNLAYVRRLGHAVIKSVEVQIGGSPIDKHYGSWIDLWYELTHTIDQEAGYAAMIGDVEALTKLRAVAAGDTLSFGSYNLFVPMQFWFCRNYGLALPLIALQYHDVRVNFEFENIKNLIVFSGNANAPTFGSGVQFGSSGLLIDYLYLDSEERKRFAQVGHEYLFEQVQFNEANLQGGTAGTKSTQNFTLNFNHPCKEIIWAHKCGAFNGANDPYSFLAYTHEDGEKAWNEQLRVAAENLITSSMTGVYESAVDAEAAYTDLPLAANAAWSYEPMSTVEIASVDTPVHGNAYMSDSTYVYIDAAVTGTSSLTVDGTTFNVTVTNQSALVVGGMYINMAALVFGTSSTYNPRQSIYDVSLDINIASGVTADSNGLIASTVNVTVNDEDHSLDLCDLSVPLSKAATDDRYVTTEDVYVIQPHNYGLCLNGKGNMVITGNLVLNGHDRFALREGSYFNYVQPYQHHTRTPCDGVNVYSFGLHPEQHQPTGTANMSRIDSARLVYSVQDNLTRSAGLVFDIYTGTTVLIYSPSYNVLRAMSGMAGTAYSN
jgi:hypothetical protein